MAVAAASATIGINLSFFHNKGLKNSLSYIFCKRWFFADFFNIYNHTAVKKIIGYFSEFCCVCVRVVLRIGELLAPLISPLTTVYIAATSGKI